MTTEPNPVGHHPPLPSAESVLRSAADLLRGKPSGDSVYHGSVLVELAREIREGSAQRQFPEHFDSVHAVEGIVCSHGRVALREKAWRSAVWYVHSDDGANCDRPLPETEHKRRMSERVAAEAHERWIQDVAPQAPAYDASTYGDGAPDTTLLRRPWAEPALAGGAPQEHPVIPERSQDECRHCGLRIRFARRSSDHPDLEWFHDLTVQTACVRSLANAHQAPTFAEPNPAG